MTVNITRGMQRRTAKLARRAALVDHDTLVAGVDIAKRESVVVFVRAADKARLGRLVIPTGPEGVQVLAERAAALRARHGLGRVTVAMEATGHLWKILARAAQRVGLGYVIVQSFVLARARELDDLTRDKSDQRDAGLLADLACERRFTETRLEAGPWAELRALAQARDGYRVLRSAALQEQRALLELTWPALLRQAPDLEGTHLQAALRLGLSPLEIAALPAEAFAARLRGEHPRRFLRWMAGRLWPAARAARADELSPATTLRLQLAAQRVQAAEAALARLDAALAATFEQTGLAWLRGQIRGLGDVLLHNLLARAGDPRRLDTARCLVKLAGSNPTERSSGEQTAAGGIHRRGRRSLRLLAFQAAVCVVRHHPDFRARYLALAKRAHRPLAPKQALVAVANKLLRVLWALATTGQAYRSPVPSPLSAPRAA